MYGLDETMMAEFLAEKAAREAAEAEAAAIAEEAARVARRAQIDADFAVQAQRRIEKKLTWIRPISAHVPATRVVKLDVEKARLSIDGVDVTVVISDREAFSSGRFGRPTGKITLSIGPLGQTSSYPQRKDGGWNYAAIVEKLLQYVDREKAKIKAQQQAEANRGVTLTLVGELNLPQYQSLVRPSSSHEGKVVVDLTQLSTKAPVLTPEKAKELLETLRTFGVKLSYNDR